MFTVVLSVFVIAGLFIHLVCSALEDVQHKLKTETKANNEKDSFKFTRLNCVQGVLNVDGKKYRTFNTGSITFGDATRNVEIDFHVGLNGCFVKDIYLCGFSTKYEIPYGINNNDPINSMLNLVDQAVKENIISRDIAQSARGIVKDFIKFSDLKEEGIIRQKSGSADYIWVG